MATLKAVLTSFLVVFSYISLVSGQDGWWKHMQLYQIYPRSFKDSNGDGIGDLRGITSRLSHIAETGATATWLSPIFPSPMKDFGYDISDFYNFAPEYGTLTDFDQLMERANELGLRIILDFVPNHTSDEHQWFQLSANKTSGYEDWYVWHPGKQDPSDPSKRLPPTNWLSIFRGSAWTWNEVRGEYYYHQFLPGQPDLNYRSPAVVAEMKNVMRFWLNRGVSGFRIDAIPHLFEVSADQFGGVLPDEPLSGTTDDTESWSYLDHPYTKDQPETVDLVIQWRAVLDEYPNERIMMLENGSPLDVVMQFYGNATHDGAQFPFNFQLQYLGNDITAERVKTAIETWLSAVPPGRTSNWLLGNHDINRAGTRYGYELSQGMVMLDLLLPGVSITYQGEEIGMTDRHLSYEETQDPAGCRAGPDLYMAESRDPARTPFHWDSSVNAGFSSAAETWLPVGYNYKDNNLADQKEQSRSYWQIYKGISQIRNNEPHFVSGTVEIVLPASNVLALGRNYGSSTYVVVINFNNYRVNVNLLEHVSNINDDRLWVMESSMSSERLYIQSALIRPDDFDLGAYESLILWGLVEIKK